MFSKFKKILHSNKIIISVDKIKKKIFINGILSFPMAIVVGFSTVKSEKDFFKIMGYTSLMVIASPFYLHIPMMIYLLAKQMP